MGVMVGEYISACHVQITGASSVKLTNQAVGASTIRRVSNLRIYGSSGLRLPSCLDRNHHPHHPSNSASKAAPPAATHDMNGSAAVDEDQNSATKLGLFCVELRTSSKYSFRLAVGGERLPLAMASPKPDETARPEPERETGFAKILRPRLPEFFKAQQLLDDHKTKRAFAEGIQQLGENTKPRRASSSHRTPR
jgi:hypothetical protein